MKVYVAQIYDEPGVSFPFSYPMQMWMRDELSEAAPSARRFLVKYGEDFKLIVRLGARRRMEENVIMGPTVFKKTKDVEYSLFLPYDAIMRAPDSRRAAVELMLSGIRAIFDIVGIETEPFDAKRGSMLARLCSDDTMIDEPWPVSRTASS